MVLILGWISLYWVTVLFQSHWWIFLIYFTIRGLISLISKGRWISIMSLLVAFTASLSTSSFPVIHIWLGIHINVTVVATLIHNLSNDVKMATIQYVFPLSQTDTELIPEVLDLATRWLTSPFFKHADNMLSDPSLQAFVAKRHGIDTRSSRFSNTTDNFPILQKCRQHAFQSFTTRFPR